MAVAVEGQSRETRLGRAGPGSCPLRNRPKPPARPMTLLTFPSSHLPQRRSNHHLFSCLRRGRDASLLPRQPGLSSITMRIRIPPASSLAVPCRVRCSRPRTLPSLVSSQSRDGPATYTSRASRSYASVPAAQLQFGQPVHETHPHILKPGECKLLLPTPSLQSPESRHPAQASPVTVPDAAAAT